jgi:hypothetical protein
MVMLYSSVFGTGRATGEMMKCGAWEDHEDECFAQCNAQMTLCSPFAPAMGRRAGSRSKYYGKENRRLNAQPVDPGHAGALQTNVTP